MATNRDSAGKFVKNSFKIKQDIPHKLVSPFLRKIVFQVLRGVVLKTPVDEGVARGGWAVGGGAQPGPTGRVDQSGTATINAGMAVIARLQPFTKTWVTNHVHYIGFLDQGRPGPGSNQAPQGMARLTLEEVTAQFGGA